MTAPLTNSSGKKIKNRSCEHPPPNKMFENFQMPKGRAITLGDLEQSDADSCVYVLSRQAGEGGDRRLEKGDYLLTDEEIKDIRFCAEHYKSFVLIINCGSSIDMAFAEDVEGINAILYISQLAQRAKRRCRWALGPVTPSEACDTWQKLFALPFTGVQLPNSI